ncbi:MAG: GNAT family N-acetyltransferase [Pseudomonadota bacterium]
MINVRPLEIYDLSMLHRWMNEPHLRPFYMWDDISLETVNAKFTPRIHGEEDCFCLLAEECGRPYGYLQWYFNRTNPQYGVGTLGYLDGVSFDYFVGDPAFLGRQLGTEMLGSAVDHVIGLVDESDREFFLIHANKNVTAIRCSERAGFNAVDEMNYNSLPSTIYTRKS